MRFTPTGEILRRLRDRVAGLTGADGAPLFEVARLYGSTDLARAFADLLVTTEKRVCLILPAGARFENIREGRRLLVKKTVSFNLIICDTDRGTGLDALFGGGGGPGVIALADAVSEALAGAQLGLPHVALEPLEGDDLEVFAGNDTADSGRKGWFQAWQTPAGLVGRSLVTPLPTATAAQP
jgi:hypothetical protein